jgi:hypothetical protein
MSEEEKITLTRGDGELILKVPKKQFQAFNAKFLAMLKEYTRKPLFTVDVGGRFHGLERGYKQRTNLEIGAFAGFLVFLFSLLVWVALAALLGPLFLTYQFGLPVIIVPGVVSFLALPLIIKYEWIGWIDCQLGDCWYIRLKYPDSLLVERIKSEILSQV